MMETVPKIIGSDIELGNFILGASRDGGTGREASRILLSHMPGVMSTHDIGSFYATVPPISVGTGYASGVREPADPRDFGRKWMTNGGCSYIDSDHLEICNPETTNAWDWLAAYYAHLMLVREAQVRASASLREELSLQVLVCNSDGKGNSFGSHLNFLMTRRAWLNIFERKMHYLLWLAGYQASSVIISGLGKVGSEHGRPPIDYQLSQRADFFEEIVSFDTMFHRPIINSRDESHCYPVAQFGRYHHISSDANLCPIANILKVGILQIILAMIEAESDLICSSVIPAAPLDAWLTFSRDPSIEATSRTIDGAIVSALDMQRRFFDAAAQFCEAGGCEGIVPRADEIVALWGETLDMFAERDWDRLAGRLDWVLKKRLLEEVFDANPGISWRSPEAKYLDLMYGNLAADEGIFWPCLDEGFVEQPVDAEAIERYKTMPPEDTRAYTRGNVIRLRGDYKIDHANWDSVTIRYNLSPGRDGAHGHFGGSHGRVFTYFLDAPFACTKEDDPLSDPLNRPQPWQVPAVLGAAGASNDRAIAPWTSQEGSNPLVRKPD